MTSCGRRSSIAFSASSLSLGEPRASAFVLEDARDHLADVGLVVDDQDVRRHVSLLRSFGSALLRCGSKPSRTGCRRRFRRDRFLCLADRQIDAHRGAFDLAVRFGASASVQRAAMLLDDLLHDGEAEPGALGAGGHVGLEQAMAVLLGQARSRCR